MTTQFNTPLSLNHLSCTEKARQDIQNFSTELTGRERQLIVLMTRDTKLCNRACERLLAKVDVQSLIKRGYLILKNSETSVETEDNLSVNKMSAINDENSSNYANNTSPVMNDDVSPAISLIAGNF